MHRLIICLLFLPFLGSTILGAEKFRLGVVGTTSRHVQFLNQLLNDPNVTAPINQFQITAAYRGGVPDNPVSWSRIPVFSGELERQGVKIYPTIEEMLPHVDGVLMLSVDARVRLEQAKSVIAARKPFFATKPMAGSLADVIEMFRLAEENEVPIFSASALRFSAGYQKMRNEKPLGNILGAATWGPCIFNHNDGQPDMFWYGIHGIEVLVTMMGAGCQTVSRTYTEGTDLLVAVWDDGRIGTFRGMRTGKQDFGAYVFGATDNGYAGGFDGYKPMLEAICNFFLTKQVPFDPQETIEIFAFMEAADVSKAKGGMPISIAETIERARTEVAIPVTLHVSASGVVQMKGETIELGKLAEALDALASEIPNSRVRVILHAEIGTSHEVLLAICNNLGKAMLANFLYGR